MVAGSAASDDRAAARPRRQLSNWLLGRPIIDAPVTWLVGRVFFPLSRLWAASELAGGDPGAFAAAVPLKKNPKRLAGHLSRVLAKIERARDRQMAADLAWQEAFFGSVTPPEAELVALEKHRAEMARALVLQRGRLVWTLIRAGAPAVRYAIPAVDEVAAAYGDATVSPSAAFRLPSPLPTVERSHDIPGRAGRDYWLRFPAPSARLGGWAWARVHEPQGVANPPTFTFANGIAAEFDQIDAPPRELIGLVHRGIRVFETEAPFHGRRRRPGEYSGEPYFSQLPLGALDLFTGGAQELGVLADWARTNGSRRVGFGGVSLGAFTSQLAAAHGAEWAPTCRPDMLFLIVTAGRLSELPARSRLAHLIDMDTAAEAAGLTADDAARWAPITDVPESPPLDPASIIAVLGARDRICPYDLGRSLATAWQVPPDNLFVRRGGHFSTPFGMMWDRKALERLEALLHAD